MKPKRQQTAKVTVSGTITKAPQRVRTATGKAMATMVIQAESELRSPYPLTLVAYDDDALTLMTSQKGNRITATGWLRWYNGYQLAGATMKI
ncbi:Uncharacterised protein [Morganella morganii]|jgi:hypothetical protein|uniref:hypothetical protein n=1 Tax=Morganella morganii TaxID=582 RepID=UPI000DA40649|nr:hypothetical protein [Morganella morganii]EJK8625124.1 hypothetical protein [Morganella morganii]EKW5730389.1 hypothetical protein [Morganella morganii]SQL16276.1 Uncharacterised protein [Morganella morganii]